MPPTASSLGRDDCGFPLHQQRSFRACKRMSQPLLGFGHLDSSDINRMEAADAEAEEGSDVGGLCNGNIVGLTLC